MRAFALCAALILCASSPHAQQPAVAPSDPALEKAWTSWQAARAAMNAHDPVKARPLARAALDALPSEPTATQWPQIEPMLASLGRIEHEAGDLESALRARKQLHARLAARLPEDSPELLTTREDLANTLSTLGDLAAASALEEQVLAVLERTRPDDDDELTRARLNHGATLALRGDPKGALALFRRVVAVRERKLPRDEHDLATARMNMGVALKVLGQTSEARRAIEGALATFEKEGADTPDALRARANLASLARDEGDLSAARALYERILERLEARLPDDHPEIQRTRMALGGLTYTEGDLPAARALLERVVATWESKLPPDAPDLASARHMYGSILRAQGDFQASAELSALVLAALESQAEPDAPDLLNARCARATALVELGELAAARDLIERGLADAAKGLSPDHVAVRNARADLGIVLELLGEHDRARREQSAALHETLQRLPSDHDDCLRGRVALAGAIAGELAARAPGVDSERTAADRAEYTRLVSETLDGLRARTLSTLAAYSPREAEERIANLAAPLGASIALAGGVGVVPADGALVEQAFRVAETTRAAGLTAARVAAHADASLVELRAAARRASSDLAAAAQSGAGIAKIEAARSALDAAQRALVLAAARLVGGAHALEPDLDLLTARLGPDTAVVTWRRYPELRFASDAQHRPELFGAMCAHVLRQGEGGKGHRIARFDLGRADAIGRAVQRWREAVERGSDRGLASNDDPEAERTARGAELRALVLDPLLPALGGARHLVLLPDFALHAVAFGALPAGPGWSGEGDALLADRVQIEVRASLVELQLTSAPRPQSQSLLALGNPSFDVPPAEGAELDDAAIALAPAAPRAPSASGPLRGGAWERGFGTLPETRAEVRGIAEYFDEAFGEDAHKVVLERRRASREGLVDLAPQATWLHVATHGWFAPESIASLADVDAGSSPLLGHGDAEERVRGSSPLALAGLALAGANLPADSSGRIPGLVTAQEISTLDLGRCELAVLSACDTSVGVGRAGQGVASLQRAVQMAGARSVVTSLWKVPDEATKDLMLELYRRLWIAKEPKWRALAAAQRKLREAKDERGARRYTTRDWAAWVLTGEQD